MSPASRLPLGTNVLTVATFDQAGNSGSDTLTVIYQSPKQDQTITFPAIASGQFGDAPVCVQPACRAAAQARRTGRPVPLRGGVQFGFARELQRRPPTRS